MNIKIGDYVRFDDIELKDNFGKVVNIESEGCIDVEYENFIYCCNIRDALEIKSV